MSIKSERKAGTEEYMKGRPIDRKKPRALGAGSPTFNFSQSGYQGFLSVGCLV